MSRKSSISFRSFLPFIILSVLVVAVLFFVSLSQKQQTFKEAGAEGYNPKIEPSEFTINITNKFSTLPAGRKLVYKGTSSEGTEKVEVTIPGTKKSIRYNGKTFTTLVYRDKVWLDANKDGVFSNKELVEDTKDYIAQNKITGDIWYFGEDVNNYENGVLVDHEGSWLTGVSGAKPGIWVKQNPVVGETYLQEYYHNVAEDTVDVLSTSETVVIAMGTFKNCLKTHDYTPLDPEANEYKYYCTKTTDGRRVRALVLEEDVLLQERLELIEASNVAGGDDD